ncbi:hypothetical protein [Streptomyces sp. BHT-5-2]|uniref:hypothetical protein n=1 Tax=Streptomyces sp. BHT-5-2 TaxID=2866715 RepID=UPI0021B14FE9|nr:hypothetical protein [Streptomyces sp. BHT-5-2]
MSQPGLLACLPLKILCRKSLLTPWQLSWRCAVREFEHSLQTVGVSPATYALPRPSPTSGQPKIGASARLALERSFASVGRKKDLRPAHMLLGILQSGFIEQ